MTATQHQLWLPTEVSAKSIFLLATLPPNRRQHRTALAVATALLLGFGITAPFAGTPLPQLNAFIPSIQAIFFINNIITAVLLFSQFSIIRSRPVLVLASGYLFTALMVIPHMLTFPGAFSPTGLLGAGLQTTVGLYIFWHLGFPAAVCGYIWLASPGRTSNVIQSSARLVIARSVGIVIALVCGFTWAATAGEEFLPRLLLDRTRFAPLSDYFVAINLSIGALTLVLLTMHRRSVLDLWLMVVMLAWIGEHLFGAVLSSGRFDLGWYAGRIYSIVTATVVLVVLLAETTRLYARLAHSHMALQREQDNKLMNVEAAVASISHEVRQPLSAIATSAGAALRFLGQTPPNHERVRSALNRMARDSHRASEILDDIRALFKVANQALQSLDVNAAALEVLGVLREELEERDITILVELAPALPRVVGHAGQLRGVVFNLVRNAMEAMGTIEAGSRTLRLRTEWCNGDHVIVTVEDTGPGIQPDRFSSIFDPFVTTKVNGMGLGLAICRMVIERHGGQLSARPSAQGSGALLQFTLPIETAENASQPLLK